MEKQEEKDKYMKKMFYYIKLNPNSSLSQGFRNKFKIQESWIQNIEV